MATSAPSLIDAVLSAVKQYFSLHPPDIHEYGTYVGAGTDPNTHVVLTSSGKQVSGVLAYKHVTSLTVNDVVELVHTDQSKRLTIVGRL